MSTQLAKLRFICDQAGFRAFWGSNPEEQAKIDRIEKEFDPYLYGVAPQEIIDELGPIADELFKDTDKFEMVILMYEDCHVV